MCIGESLFFASWHFGGSFRIGGDPSEPLDPLERKEAAGWYSFTAVPALPSLRSGGSGNDRYSFFISTL